MIKFLFILILSIFLFFGCSKEEVKLSQEPDEDVIYEVYKDALEELKIGNAFYAAKKFREAESLLPQSDWAAKASLMAAFSDYSRNSYSDAVFGLEKYITNYPADKNISYAHYLIAMCYYEQILDEKKDLNPLLS